VSGRGEIVEALPDSGAAAGLVLLVPPISISTAAVYREYAGRGTLPGGYRSTHPARPVRKARKGSWDPTIWHPPCLLWNPGWRLTFVPPPN
jgi:4-diphosphocytidyl-2C-methyl-D-erythritol kinase